MKSLIQQRLVRHWLGRSTRVEGTGGQQGLTLLETLVAIIVIGLTAAAITPAFVLTVATRVQSQKAEQALQLARAEVDEIRTLMERRGGSSQGAFDVEGTLDDEGNEIIEIRESFLPKQAPGDEPVLVGVPNEYLGPNSPICSDSVEKPDWNVACGVELSCEAGAADCEVDPDFAVQIYQVNQLEDEGRNTVAFQLGVRVYAIEAVEENLGGLSFDPETGVPLARLGLTSSPRRNEASSFRSAPLAAIYTTVFRSDAEQALCEYYEFQGADPSAEGLAACI